MAISEFRVRSCQAQISVSRRMRAVVVKPILANQNLGGTAHPSWDTLLKAFHSVFQAGREYGGAVPSRNCMDNLLNAMSVSGPKQT